MILRYVQTTQDVPENHLNSTTDDQFLYLSLKQSAQRAKERTELKLMKVALKWQNAMKFSALADGNSINMDAKSPIGQGTAMTPKELVAAGLGGCSAMDVAALLKKHKQTPTSFDVEVDVEMSKGGSPTVFTQVVITYSAAGEVSRDVFVDAVVASQTKYCGVSAMMVKACPVLYKVVLNGEEVASGQADFGGVK
jgi:putative redox protein